MMTMKTRGFLLAAVLMTGTLCIASAQRPDFDSDKYVEKREKKIMKILTDEQYASWKRSTPNFHETNDK